jgi:hypothetical protein
MKTYCGETLNGRPYYFQPEDCFRPIDKDRAVLIAKDESPILRNVPVRRCDIKRGFVEHDSVFDLNNQFLGALVIVNDQFMIYDMYTKKLSDLPENVVTYWHRYRPELFCFYSYPSVEIDVGDTMKGCNIPLSAILYKKGGKVITTAKKGYNLLTLTK